MGNYIFTKYCIGISPKEFIGLPKKRTDFSKIAYFEKQILDFVKIIRILVQRPILIEVFYELHGCFVFK